MATGRVFQSNRSQAVRLPKAMEFPPEIRDVGIRRVGHTRVISPANAMWDDFFAAEAIDLGERDQAPQAERDAL